MQLQVQYSNHGTGRNWEIHKNEGCYYASDNDRSVGVWEEQTKWLILVIRQVSYSNVRLSL